MVILKTIKKNKVNFFLIGFSLSFYLLNNLIFKIYSTGEYHYFFVCYFNDLLCPLFFVSYTNIMLSLINKRIEKLYHIILYCFLCGFVWEFVAPLLKEGSVTDFYDLICYCIGGLLYWIIRYSIFKINKIKGDKK